MKNKRTITYFFGCLVLLAGVLARTKVVLAVPNSPQLPPVLNEGSPKAIPGQYIVVFKPDARQKPGTPAAASKRGVVRQDVLAAQETVKRLGGTIGFTYTSALIGFSAKLPPNALEALRAMPGVAYIEADQKYSFDTIQSLVPPIPT